MSGTWKLVLFIGLANLAAFAQAFFAAARADFRDQRVKAEEFIARADRVLREEGQFVIDEVSIKPRIRGCHVKAHWTGENGTSARAETTL